MQTNALFQNSGRMLVFGDSYSAGAVDLNGNTDGPILEDEKRWWHFVAQSLNRRDVRCYARNGAGFCGMEPHNTFADQLDEAGPDASVTLVMLAGGRNDGHPGSQKGNVRSRFELWLERAIGLYPNATFLIIPFMWDCGMWRMNNEQRANYSSILEVARTFSHPERLIVIEDAWTWGWGLEDCYGVFLHPNDAGHRMLASHVISSLYGGNGQQARQWSREISTIDFKGWVRLTFANGLISRDAEIVVQRENTVGSHEVLASFPSAGFAKADLPGCCSAVLSTNADVRSIIAQIEPQRDITGNPDMIPKKNVSHIVLRNVADTSKTIYAGTVLTVNTGFRSFMTAD